MQAWWKDKKIWGASSNVVIIIESTSLVEIELTDMPKIGSVSGTLGTPGSAVPDGV